VSSAFAEIRPSGGTILAPVLQTALQQFFDKAELSTAKGTPVRKMTIVVVTDGRPQDKEDVITTIVDTATKLKALKGSRDWIGIDFVQIGTDKGASAFLKELDDDLVVKHKASFDLVSTIPLSMVEQRGGVLAVLLDAIQK